MGKPILLPDSSPFRGPSFCWQCFRDLMKKKGGGYFYAVVTDPVGGKHRVHHDCVKAAVADGARETEERA